MFRELLPYAVLAPSTHNTQPWRFRVLGDDAVEVWADPARALHRIDPARRQMLMSCGAALFHLRIGMRSRGVREVVEYLPEPGQPQLLARVHRDRPGRPSKRDLELFAAIPHRRTHRAPFATRPVSSRLSDILEREAAFEGAWLTRLHPHDKLEVAYAIARGDRKQLADPRYRDELARWMAPRGSSRRDGIPMSNKDVMTALPLAGPALVRALDRGEGVAARELELAALSPMLAVLGTDGDDPLDWLGAGEAMEAVLLRATQLGLAASFLNQALEEPELRAPIARAVRRTGHPQLILRLGWPTRAAVTAPRRPIDAVLV